MKQFIVLILLGVCHVCVNSQTADGPVFPPVFRPWHSLPAGHMRQFGSQKSPDGPVRPYHDRYLHPVDFWKYHVKDKVPLVYRNAIGKSPAIKLWDDEYLLKNYGDLDVLVERKVENRSYSPQRMMLKNFLDQYRSENIYVVTVLPDAMRHEVQIVPSILCGTFKTYLQETNLWIGSGGTSSVIHFDADHNIHCLVHGRKSHSSGSGWSLINVDKVDMKKFPLVDRVPWTYATLRAGDCIFLPGGYIHQVRSHGRSISVTTLFSPTNHFNSSGCDNVSMDYLPMSEAPIHWTYKKGDETIDLGYTNLVLVHSDLKQIIKTSKSDIIDQKTFKKHFTFTERAPPGAVDIIFKKYLDPDGDGTCTKDEIENLSIETLKAIARQIDNPAGPLKSASKIDWQPNEDDPNENEDEPNEDRDEEEDDDEEDERQNDSEDPDEEDEEDEENPEYQDDPKNQEKLQNSKAYHKGHEEL